MSVATLLAGGLRLFCPLEQCKTIEVAAPVGGYTAGTLVLHEGVIGVPYKTVAEAATAVLIYDARDIEVPCVAAGAGNFPVGAKVYYDATNLEVTEVGSGNTFCGIVMVKPATGEEKVRIAILGAQRT